MDEFKEERDRIKNGSFKDKAKYFFSYYTVHVVVGFFALILLAVLIKDMVSQKEYALNAIMLNSIQEMENSAELMSEDFASYAEIDTDKNVVNFDYSIAIVDNPTSEYEMYGGQKLLVYTSAGDVDVLMGGADIFPDYANGELFVDIRDVLTDEQTEKYKDHFYYVDAAYVAEINSEDNIYDASYVAPEAPDPTKPEDMQDPIPIGVFVTDCEKLTDNIIFYDESFVALGIPANAKHPETAVKLIEYLFE
ncbi:MAG: hypothetical protein K6D96_05805 [Acetatifactor sp.]|nr:hypothetical protein [Acetatifactor sp.]